eukprot:GILJ01008131.1.p1 GENE.GILJ01008131.1~~GILJ01008131.1.p1  ORF type:complete len:782 (+),score=80.00 GILJ01008131.1:1636-3981(+)
MLMLRRLCCVCCDTISCVLCFCVVVCVQAFSVIPDSSVEDQHLRQTVLSALAQHLDLLFDTITTELEDKQVQPYESNYVVTIEDKQVQRCVSSLLVSIAENARLKEHLVSASNLQSLYGMLTSADPYCRKCAARALAALAESTMASVDAFKSLPFTEACVGLLASDHNDPRLGAYVAAVLHFVCGPEFRERMSTDGGAVGDRFAVRTQLKLLSTGSLDIAKSCAVSLSKLADRHAEVRQSVTSGVQLILEVLMANRDVELNCKLVKLIQELLSDQDNLESIQQYVVPIFSLLNRDAHWKFMSAVVEFLSEITKMHPSSQSRLQVEAKLFTDACCTSKYTAERTRSVQQEYNCSLCGIPGGLCSICSLICHKDHGVKLLTEASFVCHCSNQASGRMCKALEPRLLMPLQPLSARRVSEVLIDSPALHSSPSAPGVTVQCSKLQGEQSLTITFWLYISNKANNALETFCCQEAPELGGAIHGFVDSTLRLGFTLPIRTDESDSHITITSRVAVPIGSWFHTALVCQPGDATLYLNGVIQNHSTSYGRFQFTNDPFSIGKPPPGVYKDGGTCLDSFIEKFMLHPKTLTPEEVIQNKRQFQPLHLGLMVSIFNSVSTVCEFLLVNLRIPNVDDQTSQYEINRLKFFSLRALKLLAVAPAVAKVLSSDGIVNDLLELLDSELVVPAELEPFPEFQFSSSLEFQVVKAFDVFIGVIRKGNEQPYPGERPEEIMKASGCWTWASGGVAFDDGTRRLGVTSFEVVSNVRIGLFGLLFTRWVVLSTYSFI